MTTDGAMGARRPLAPPAFGGAHCCCSLPQAGGGLGWGLFSPPHIRAKLNRLAPTLPSPASGGGNCERPLSPPSRIPVPASPSCPYRIPTLGGFTTSLHTLPISATTPHTQTP